MSATLAAASSPRRMRTLTKAEQKIQQWVKKNHGVMSEIARELDLSVQFVARIAYNQNAQSAGFRVEHRLRQKGCPLIQRIG